jgi:hypothetical protein
VGRIVVTQYLSLDGVMEAPGPRDVEDFKYPVILGAGSKMFGQTSEKKPMGWSRRRLSATAS